MMLLLDPNLMTRFFLLAVDNYRMNESKKAIPNCMLGGGFNKILHKKPPLSKHINFLV